VLDFDEFDKAINAKLKPLSCKVGAGNDYYGKKWQEMARDLSDGCERISSGLIFLHPS
jgi:hypothetical protein